MPFSWFKGGMKGAGAGAGTASSRVRIHTTATATAATAVGARGHFPLQKATATQVQPPNRSSLSGRPLTAGTLRQQDHWLSDFWPQRSLFPSISATPASATCASVQTIEERDSKASHSQRSSLDVQRDVPLPDEPTTPAQQREAPFLDAASSSSADSSAASAAHPASEPSSPSSTAVSSSTAGDTSASRGFPAGHVAVTLLVPSALAGWLIGPGGATAKSITQPDVVWWLADKHESFGGPKNLRLLNIVGLPEAIRAVALKLLAHIFAEGAPANQNYFRTKDGRYKAKVLFPGWLVGTLLGKQGKRIREMQQSSGTQMQIVQVDRALSLQSQPQLPKRRQEEKPQSLGGKESVAQIAAGSMESIAAAIQEIAQSFANNPKYTPVFRSRVPKHAETIPRSSKTDSEA